VFAKSFLIAARSALVQCTPSLQKTTAQCGTEVKASYELFSRTITQIGAGSRNRTRDLRFTKPLLYQLSYAGA
jgi:hypothetical protein